MAEIGLEIERPDGGRPASMTLWRESGAVRMSDFRRSLMQVNDMKEGSGMILHVELDAPWCADFLRVSQDFNTELHGPGGVVQGVVYPTIIGSVVSLVLPGAKPRDLPIKVVEEVPIGSTIIVRIACLQYRKMRRQEVWRVAIAVVLHQSDRNVVAPVEFSLFRPVTSS